VLENSPNREARRTSFDNYAVAESLVSIPSKKEDRLDIDVILKCPPKRVIQDMSGRLTADLKKIFAYIMKNYL
jgi:hypothetical protein